MHLFLLKYIVIQKIKKLAKDMKHDSLKTGKIRLNSITAYNLFFKK